MTRLVISRLGQFGDGVAESDGSILHIPKVLPGETVELIEGQQVEVVSTSPDRIEPFCPSHSRCGGCKLQHWRQEPYAEWKRNLLVNALAAKGFNPAVDVLHDAHGLGRRRVSLHVRQQNGQWKAGFMAEGTHSLCAISECPVLTPELRHAPQIAAAFGSVLGNCDVAATAADNGIDVAVKAERKAVSRRLDALREICEHWRLARLAINGESLFTFARPHVTMGRAKVELPIHSFLQATREGEETLARLAVEGLDGCREVADLFCGVGPFALRLAENRKVFAADSDKSAIAALQHAGRHAQGLKPISAETRDLFRAPLVVSELNSFDGVVFDPPRAGAETQTKQLATSKVKRIVAVSCDVQTFARDASILVDGGYSLKRAVPVDQFKWTAHLEMVGFFSR